MIFLKNKNLIDSHFQRFQQLAVKIGREKIACYTKLNPKPFPHLSKNPSKVFDISHPPEFP